MMQNKTSKWVTKNPQESQLFHHFNKSMNVKVEVEPSFFHMHKYGISMDTYRKNEHLQKEIKVLQTYSNNSMEVIDSIEFKEYPFFGTLYHPEFQSNLEFVKENKLPIAKNQLTQDISMAISKSLNDLARENKNQVTDEKSIEKYLIKDDSKLKDFPLTMDDHWTKAFMF